MNGKTSCKSNRYNYLTPDDAGSDSVPIPAPGIGTRISEAAARLGSRKFACNVMHISADSLQRYIREENMPPFDVIARLCAAADCSMEWIASGVDDALVDQPHSLGNVRIAVELLREVLDSANATLSPALHAEAVILIVGLLESGLPDADVIPLARQAIKMTARGQDERQPKAASK